MDQHAVTHSASPAGPHPVATFGDILMPRALAASQSLLAWPGLELTYNGRGALLRACAEIAARGKRDILLPAFHCPSGVTPAIHAGLKPVFYHVRRDLSIDIDDLRAKVTDTTAAVLVIHYFGMATDLTPLQSLQERGIALIEDWSHSFLQGPVPRLAGTYGDYRIYSFWKLAPSLIGGGLWRRRVDGAVAPAMLAPPARERIVRLKRMLEEALNHSEHERAKNFFARLEAWRVGRHHQPAGAPDTNPAERDLLPGENHYPFDPRLAHSRMPWMARRILESSDLATLMAARRSNFKLYLTELAASRQFLIPYPELPEQSCPWVFPILLRQRDETDFRWRAEGVALHTFGIYLHSALFADTDAQTIADAQYLSTHLLCLAIHQGIGAEQIRRSASTINAYLRPLGAASQGED